MALPFLVPRLLGGMERFGVAASRGVPVVVVGIAASRGVAVVVVGIAGEQAGSEGGRGTSLKGVCAAATTSGRGCLV